MYTTTRVRYLDADSFADALTFSIECVDGSKTVGIELVRRPGSAKRYSLTVTELAEVSKERKLSTRETWTTQLGYLVRQRFELRDRLRAVDKRIDELKNLLAVK
jgi:hypothetical protein